MTEWLIIFTRYPLPGTTKTRLIPALGPERAADCQRQMTEHTVAIARSLQTVRPVHIDIRFTGGTQIQMQQWLGADLALVPQGEGDLGARLSRSFQTAFDNGATRVIAIGIDCPQLDRRRLVQAFESLHQQTGVIGPATDGGYYLIGLSQWVPELFNQIAWGTETVLAETQAIAAARQIALAYLDPLNDVDYPEDLTLWQQVKANPAATAISVIIPLLNEAQTIDATLDHLLLAPQEPTLPNPPALPPSIEVIAVDGGSQDNTVEKVRDRGIPVIQTQPNRAYQMNIGAQAATGDCLLFLHGDSWLPPDFGPQVQQCLSQPDVIAGAFDLKIRDPYFSLRWVEWGIYWRSRWFQMPYGDQGIFLKAETFHRLGGFPNLPIMEDFEFVRQLKQQGRIAMVPNPVHTSARRWQALGVVRTTLINQVMIAAYALGVSPSTLAHWYRQQKRS